MTCPLYVGLMGLDHNDFLNGGLLTYQKWDPNRQVPDSSAMIRNSQFSHSGILGGKLKVSTGDLANEIDSVTLDGSVHSPSLYPSGNVGQIKTPLHLVNRQQWKAVSWPTESLTNECPRAGALSSVICTRGCDWSLSPGSPVLQFFGTSAPPSGHRGPLTRNPGALLHGSGRIQGIPKGAKFWGLWHYRDSIPSSMDSPGFTTSDSAKDSFAFEAQSFSLFQRRPNSQRMRL
ncbi:hypothetical protein PDE_04986 [Penicillium oxalicum 114-2]|uniref:Uncharacterized protein n=1 Tax=Penicillium oxalicum (strain 114-2 / CGMCC 5302) TaxID=933388 RepID=S7ZMX1_PENO1|nr:hypothetical protein PDE_04986 [Penicillium oxalicum 114-2]